MNHIIILWSGLGIYHILGSIGLISALIVVSAKNPIHRIAALIIVFMVGALIFMHLDYYFLGLVYTIVYVGAIAILFLFVIMMVPVYTATTDDRSTLPNMWYSHTPATSLGHKNNNSALWFRKENLITGSSQVCPSLISTHAYAHYMQNMQVPVEHIETKNHIVQYNIAKLLIIIGILLLLILPIHMSYIYDNSSIDMLIYSYFYPSWVIEYKTLTDIESLAILIYVAYPTALLLIGITLWVTMVGIISICSPRNYAFIKG